MAAISTGVDAAVGHAASPAAPARPAPTATVWGLDVLQLHDRFWAARGIQVVRQGERSEIIPHAELFLLLDPRTVCLFGVARVIDQLSWLNADLMLLRLLDSADHGYREIAVTDDDGRFIRFRRDYGVGDTRLARVGLTPLQSVARVWQQAPTPREGWRKLRRAYPSRERWTMSVRGRVYDRQNDREMAAFARALVETWREPDSTIPGIEPIAPDVWGPRGAKLERGATYTPPLWLGAGRALPEDAAPIGPAVLWDDPAVRPTPGDIQWLDLEPSAPPTFNPPKPKGGASLALKRAFDVVFASAALTATLPLYPFIAAAIYLEDPGPIFFVHGRQTKGGKEFGCIKFRSMRRNSEALKRQLQAQNQADGPQFYIAKDPRVTRVGAFLRKCQLDELPQFINVLMGDMSVVGPRPSPHSENQYCPPWREARLSVKPGVTGLWQVMRTRATGADFQEWIRYDIEYVERQSFWLDLWIIWKTVLLSLRGVARS